MELSRPDIMYWLQNVFLSTWSPMHPPAMRSTSGSVCLACEMAASTGFSEHADYAGVLPTPEDQAIMDEKIGTALNTAEHVHEAQVRHSSSSKTH